jgi:hypothetical protein
MATSLPPIVARTPTTPSPWTRTVVVVRFPRFSIRRSSDATRSDPDDPLAAFTSETDLQAVRGANGTRPIRRPVE